MTRSAPIRTWVDAHFDAEDGTLILRSRGGTKGAPNAVNTEYAEGLRLLLDRVDASELEIQGIWVDSSQVRSLPPEERRIFSAADANLSPSELFTRLSSRMAAVGRNPGATGGRGNSNKRLRVEFAGGPNAERIAAIAGSRPADGTGQSTGRLPADELNRVSSDHIWRAVQLLQAGNADHPFGESTDYDVMGDDGQRLPPKAVFGIAASEALGFDVLPKHFSAGVDAICFKKIRSAGFQIVRKGEAPEAANIPADAEERAWAEGSPRMVTHLRKERGSGLAAAKKAEFRRQHGRLFCERCGLDPQEVYGAQFGDACIEAHHDAVQVSEMGEGHRTSLDQLICLCANCHRVVHRELREGV